MRKQSLVYAVLFGITSLLSFPVHGQETSTSMTEQGVNEKEVADRLYYDAVKAEILGNTDQAEDMFLRFLKMKPNEAAAYCELSKINAKNNKQDKAETYIKKAIELDDSNKWYKEQYASILANRNQFEAAADVLKKLAEKESRNNDYLMMSALLYERAGKYKEALEQLNKSLAQNGPDEDMLLRKEQIYVKVNNLDSAAVVIYQLIALDPKQSKYYTLLAELYDQAKEHDKALAVYRQAQKVIPDDPSVNWGLAEHFRKLDDTAKYNEYAVKAITSKGLDAATQLSLFVAYLQNQRNEAQRRDQGEQIAREIIAQHPESADAHTLYGDILRLNGKKAEALEQYKLALNIEPSKLAVWQQLLTSYLNKEDADSLIHYSEKALSLFPNQAVLHYLRGVGEMNKGDYIEAIRSINRAIDMQPESNKKILVQMYSSLGDIYNTTKQYELSDSCMEKVLSLDPDNATILNNYAYYLSERKERLDKAESMSKRSLELQPGIGLYLDTYAWIMYQQKKYKKARDYEEKAIAAEKEDVDGTLYDHMGDIYYQLGDIDKAIENWQQAKEKGVDNPNIDKKIQERKLYE